MYHHCLMWLWTMFIFLPIAERNDFFGPGDPVPHRSSFPNTSSATAATSGQFEQQQQQATAFGGQPQANFRHSNQNPIQQPPAHDYSGHTHTTTTTDHTDHTDYRSHHEVDASQRNGTSVCGGHGHGPNASCAARPTYLKFNSLNSSIVPHFHLAQTPTVRNITEPVVFKRQRSISTLAIDENELIDTLTPLPDFLPTPFPPLLCQKSMSADNIPVLCINDCRVFSPQKETLSPFKSPNAASNPNRNMVQGQQQQAQPQFQPPLVCTCNQQFVMYLHQLVMHSPNCPLPGCPCCMLQHDFNKLMAYQKVAVESANAAVAAAATSGQYFTYAPNVNGVPGPSPYTQQEAAIYSTDELYAHCKYGLYGKSN